MIIEVKMSDPDALFQALSEQVEDNDVAVAYEICKRWFERGKTITIMIDTAIKTAYVKELEK